MKHTIGLINGGGTGPEIVGATKRVIKAIENFSGQSFELVEDFDNKKYEREINIEKWNRGIYNALIEFYNRISEMGGAILRGSFPAPILYKIRTDMGFDSKLIPLNPYPEYSIKPEFDILLVRENSHGIYHCDEIQGGEAFVKGSFHYDRNSLEHLAQISFKQANQRKKKLALVLKTSVLEDIGKLWEEVFQEKSKQFSNVEYFVRPSGAGLSDMYLFPQQYDVVVTDDQGGDIIADIIPTMLYNTRDIVPQLNIRKDGFCVYQTDHGTVRYLEGQDKMNPIGMITALSMALEYSFGMRDDASKLREAVNKTLSQGYRTQDMYQQGQELVGTRKMTDKIIENLYF